MTSPGDAPQVQSTRPREVAFFFNGAENNGRAGVRCAARSGPLLADLVGGPRLARRRGNLPRQLHREHGADADLGLALDRSPVPLDELVHDRQAQTGALADVLG